ncbi:MAG: protein YgfX [Methylococcaceae bacterium]
MKKKPSDSYWKITESVWQRRILSIIYSLAFIACFMNALPWVICVSLASVVFWHGWQTLKRLARENWLVNYHDEDGWRLTELGATHSIEILPSTVISRRLIFLHYQHDGKKRYRIIAKDALLPNFNDYRQLLVTLKTY